jgi:hypothetical protein
MSVCYELPQESANALAIQLREKILNKIEKAKSSDELKDIIINILAENDDQLDIEQIQINGDVLGGIEKYLACTIQENEDNLNSVQIEVGEVLKKAIDLICNPPTFQIPYPYPVIDISANFSEKILVAILRLAIKIILSIIKKLLSLIVEICATGLSVFNGYGNASFADIISQSIGDNISTSFINDVFGAFGINSNGSPAEINTLEGESCLDPSTISNLKNTMQFLDDLSFMLTPVEICGLFNNKPTDQAYKVVEELLEFEYPALKTRLNNRTKIVDLFKTLGSKNDPSICQLIEDNAEKILSRPEICFTENTNKLREDLLRNKGLTDNEISEQLQKERDRNKANLEKISQLAAQIKSNPNKIFGEQPQIFCKEGKAGIISMDQMPSLQQSIGSALDSTYNVYASTVNKNLKSYSSTITTSSKTFDSSSPVIEKFITLNSVDSEGSPIAIRNALNPTFIQKTTSGEFELSDSSGNTDSDSVLRYYGLDGFTDIITADDTIKLQTLLNETDINNFGGNNVYIKNYSRAETLLDTLRQTISDESIDTYLRINVDSMSIDFQLPIKEGEEVDFVSLFVGNRI